MVYARVYPASFCYRVRLIGYPAWIRTKNNASKGRAVLSFATAVDIC